MNMVWPTKSGLPVWYSEPLNATVHRQNIGHVTVVKPKARCIYQHCPVVGMITLEKFIRNLRLQMKWCCTALRVLILVACFTELTDNIKR